jgi:hypothetical protein
MDETYGWQKPGQSNWRIRKDRNEFSYEQLADDMEKSYRTVSRAMSALVSRKIVIQYRKPKKGQNGIFGINSETDEWIRSGKIGRQGCLQKTSHIHRQGCPPILPTVSTKNAANPHEQRDTARLILDLNPILCKGGYENRSKTDSFATGEIVLITDPTEARGSAIDFKSAEASAAQAYLRAFALPLAEKEHRSLRQFLSIAPKSKFDSMLVLWLMAIPKAKESRAERKRDPERKRYVAKRPFNDVLQTAADLYQEAIEKSKGNTA